MVEKQLDNLMGSAHVQKFEEFRLLIRAWRARLRDQKSELAALRRHIKPGDIVCDVGANKGSYTYWLSRWAGSGRVVAFEPQPEFARMLVKNCAKLHMENVTVEQQAVCHTSGTMSLFIPVDHKPGASLSKPDVSHEVIEVKTTSLDGYFTSGQHISALKIDVEGAEFDVLRGAERILKQDRPLIVFECEQRHLPKGSLVTDVFEFLVGLGYDGCFVCRGDLLPIADFDVSTHQSQSGEWFWKEKGYCNNFVFWPKGVKGAMT